MATIDELAKDFLAQKRIAVAGVSRTRNDAANIIYRALKAKDYQAYPLNPQTDTFDGDACYPDIKSISEKVDGIVIVTKPLITDQIVRECIEIGVNRVWMHCMFGTRPWFGRKLAKKIGSVSEEAVNQCKENDIMVIPGSCPMQFIGDFGHTCMRWFFRLMGSL